MFETSIVILACLGLLFSLIILVGLSRKLRNSEAELKLIRAKYNANQTEFKNLQEMLTKVTESYMQLKKETAKKE